MFDKYFSHFERVTPRSTEIGYRPHERKKHDKHAVDIKVDIRLRLERITGMGVAKHNDGGVYGKERSLLLCVSADARRAEINNTGQRIRHQPRKGGADRHFPQRSEW